MFKKKYIEIENELKSFKDDTEIDFEDWFQLLKKGQYFDKSETAIRSSIGNGYYVDGCEAEIITPPIAINKGFATRVTDALILGRNYVIKNTPELEHTGYSMHWNFSHDEEMISVNEHRKLLMGNIVVPFQLFGLTPVSCGFNIRADKYEGRYEILGDSLTNEDQIKATALLFGAYSMAIGIEDFMRSHIFPISILDQDDKNYMKNIMTEGRYTEFDIKTKHGHRTTQAQNILELFYEWLSPFVYKLGEREEINNLEAFIKGEKRLEMDEIKYFHLLKDSGGIDGYYTYLPIEVPTPNGTRSPILKVSRDDDITVPIEGVLLGSYATNSPKKRYITTHMDWSSITLKDCPLPLKRITGEDAIFRFAAEQIGLEYTGSMDLSNITPNNINNRTIIGKLRKRIEYEADKDLSA